MMTNANISAEDSKIENHLRAAMKYVREVCVLGSGNLIEDIIRTGAWSFTQQFHYHPSGRYVRAVNEGEGDDMFACNMVYDVKKRELVKPKLKWYYRVDNIESAMFHQSARIVFLRGKGNPLLDHIPDDRQVLISVFTECMRTSSTRSGSCGPRSALLTKYLWEHPEHIQRIEGINMLDFDHGFVIVNREGNLSRPETWGNAWIVDAWANGGMIYRAADFMKKITEVKLFCKKNIAEQAKIGIIHYPVDMSSEIAWEQGWEVRPGIDQYPSYDKDMFVEDYFSYHDQRFSEDAERVEAEAQHHNAFKPCLRELSALKSNQKWAGFFHHDNIEEECLPHPGIIKKANR